VLGICFLYTVSRASLIRNNWDSGMFGLVHFLINRVLQNTRPGGGGQRFSRALEWRSQPGAGNNVNKRAVNSFLSAASTVLVYSSVLAFNSTNCPSFSSTYQSWRPAQLMTWHDMTFISLLISFTCWTWLPGHMYSCVMYWMVLPVF
jgi:hypothetical protein